MDYSIKFDPETTAKAFGREFHCSPKHSENIARALSGMDVSKAKQYLEEIIIFKKALPFKTHKRMVSHKKGIGPGGYPQKSCRFFLEVLKNAENNAEYKGLNPENMYIAHVSAYKGRVIRGFMPRAFGRSSAWNEQTTNIEIIIAEKEEEEE